METKTKAEIEHYLAYYIKEAAKSFTKYVNAVSSVDVSYTLGRHEMMYYKAEVCHMILGITEPFKMYYDEHKILP